MSKLNKIPEGQCYNCENTKANREHIIPSFILNKGEEGLFAPCCENCQKNLNFLDDNASLYFKVFNNTGSLEEQRTAFRHLIYKNGSPTSLRFFSDKKIDNNRWEIAGDIVADENLFMRFIHKICVGVTYRIYGKLDDAYKIHIFNNFSRLGGFCEYNNPIGNSYSEEQTKKIEIIRDRLYIGLKSKTVNIYGRLLYKTNNSKVSYTKKRVHGAYWVDIVLFKNFKILCAITDTKLLDTDFSLNMAYAVFPIRINLSDLNKYREKNKQVKKGDSPSMLYFPKILAEFKDFLKLKLQADGIKFTDIEFEIFFDRFCVFAKKTINEEEWDRKYQEYFRKNFKYGRLYIQPNGDQQCQP